MQGDLSENHHTQLESLLNRISHDPYLFSISDYTQSAWIGHAPFLKFLIRELRPKTFVELGVHNGFSYFVGCQAIKECGIEANAFAIDHWAGDEHAGIFDDSTFQAVTKLNQQYLHFSTLLRMSFSQASSRFELNSIDLLHIDGFHSYESIKEDFETWISRVSTNGIVLLHDIHVRRNTFGVYRYWEEIRSQYKTIEFVGAHGLGVIFLGEIPLGDLQVLFNYAQEGSLGRIQGTFGSISDDVIQGFRYRSIEACVEERDRVIEERDRVLNSTTWKIFGPYRKFIQSLLALARQS